MGKISQEKVIQDCCTIAQELYENPLITIKLLAQNVEIARNTASKYLKRMYARNQIIGPWLTLRPHQNYKEYVHLMNFSIKKNIQKIWVHRKCMNENKI